MRGGNRFPGTVRGVVWDPGLSSSKISASARCSYYCRCLAPLDPEDLVLESVPVAHRAKQTCYFGDRTLAPVRARILRGWWLGCDPQRSEPYYPINTKIMLNIVSIQKYK